ncbi:kinase suppressor of Ras 2 isoform X2 [Onthophagus taurus]|uniref:kinase suppressor of Ras 2 isoform X2 n=1 Tax=Onthophagus taurus TaxID=166361 RepID=UPI000C20D653|nr:kinase suppressor of Ras 2 isoform X2 [Onthophagus taurus]
MIHEPRKMQSAFLRYKGLITRQFSKWRRSVKTFTCQSDAPLFQDKYKIETGKKVDNSDEVSVLNKNGGLVSLGSESATVNDFSVMADETADKELKKNIAIMQSMIDASAERLEGLRTQCATSAELTQQEIRTLEGKLIKMFSELLVMKGKLRYGEMPHSPSLTQWLQVVGLCQNSIQGLCQKISSVEELQERSEYELKSILSDKGARTEELSRLCRAVKNLKKCMDVLKRGDKDCEQPLHWDSWDRQNTALKLNNSPRPPRGRSSRASVPSVESLGLNNNRGGALPPSCSVSSISSLNAQTNPWSPLTPPPQGRGKVVKLPTTPPPQHRLNIGVQSTVFSPEIYPLTKSRSHELQLAATKNDNNEIHNSNETTGRRARLPTEPGPEGTQGYNSPLLPSPVRSPPYNTDSDDNSFKSTLQVPKSPRTPTIGRGMGHQIAHRFTKTFKVVTTCGVCLKPIYFGTGLKCKECKYKCHRECEDKVTPSCGLPPELLDEFKKNCEEVVFYSPNTGRANKNFKNLKKPRKHSHPQPGNNIPFPLHDSSSNSSCNSSTPSSPALQPAQTPPQHQYVPPAFHFPDVENGVTLQTFPLLTVPSVVEEQQSEGSDQTVTGSTSTSDSDRTPVRVDSQDSQVSDTDTLTDGPRWTNRQNSLSMKEWDIPYDELDVEDLIGTGRFGKVYRGYWYGDVAIKVLNMEYVNDETTLEHFKMEVSTFRKTRHENLVLFMGACMKPPRLAIVTSLSKGHTLYTLIHLRKDKFNMNKTTIVAQQITQGMGYLHAKGILHKDLKTKNIFLENGKVVITDFGLFSVTKLCHGDRKGDSLGIPPGWLCYLAPELIRSLHADQAHNEDLPFSNASDVYAFGTVWYELLCGEWPFKDQPPETIIWQVGKGMKQSLANLQASRDVKDILMLCWSFLVKDRPNFNKLFEILDRLPKKRLARSPSHPVHLSRSAESVF